jgi:uncharacterized protein with NAD-binding domain and iron-sulfur cluster
MGQPAPPVKKKQLAIIGSGWAGLGALHSIQLADGAASLEVFLLDGSRELGGLAATSTANRQPVEPGIKGFWSQYANIDRVRSSQELLQLSITHTVYRMLMMCSYMFWGLAARTG